MKFKSVSHGEWIPSNSYSWIRLTFGFAIQKTADKSPSRPANHSRYTQQRGVPSRY